MMEAPIDLQLVWQFTARALDCTRQPAPRPQPKRGRLRRPVSAARAGAGWNVFHRFGIGRICRLAAEATAAAKGLAALPFGTFGKGGEGTRRRTYRDF